MLVMTDDADSFLSPVIYVYGITSCKCVCLFWLFELLERHETYALKFKTKH